MKKNYYFLRYLNRTVNTPVNFEMFQVIGIIIVTLSLALLSPLLGLAHVIGAALFTPSPIMGELRKKAGSDVFSKNKAGAYIRKRVKPRNPRTSYQLDVRGSTSQLSKIWKSGTPNIAAFNSFASGNPVKNRMGNTMYLTGLNWYMKWNRVIDYLEGTRITAPGAAQAFKSYNILLQTIGFTPFQLKAQVDVTGTTADLYYMFYASKPKSAGTSSNQQYSLIAYQPSTGQVYQLKSVYNYSTSVKYACGANGLILVSTDGGNTFTSQVTGIGVNLNKIIFISASVGVCVGDGGTVIYTTNGGTSWNATVAVTSYNLHDIAGDAAHMYTCGNSGTILYSTDSGVTWALQSSTTSANLYGIAALAGTTADCIAVGATGTLLYTSNSGTTWAAVTSGVLLDLYSVAYITGPVCVAVGKTGTIIYSTAPATTWASAAASAQDLYSVSIFDSTHAFASGANGLIIKSATPTAATAWTVQTTGITKKIYGISFESTTNGYAVGEDNTYLATTDGGTTWTATILDATTFDISNDYYTRFGAATVGQKIFMKIEQAWKTTGQTDKPGQAVSLPA